MKGLAFSILALMFAIYSGAQIPADHCVKCGKRLIIFWDIDLRTPKPVTSDDSIHWKQLHYISKGCYEFLVNNENYRCLAFLPCRIGDNEPPWKNPCPFSEKAETTTSQYDYHILGEVEGHEGDYLLSVYLTTVKREIVARATVNYTSAEESIEQGKKAIRKLIADNGKPTLFEVIYDYELKKRNNAQGIRSNMIAFQPKVIYKTHYYLGKCSGKIPISAKVLDCDGESIKAAHLVFQAFEGRFESNDVYTDETGVVNAVYNAPAKAVNERLKIEYNYDHPSGKIGFESDVTTIETGNLRFTETEYTAPADEMMPLDIVVEGFTKETIQKSIIELSVQNGTLDRYSVKPDASGKVSVQYFPPFEGDGDVIKAELICKDPDIVAADLSDTRRIKIQKPIDTLLAVLDLSIYSKLTIRSGELADKITETTTDITCQLECGVNNYILRQFITNPASRNADAPSIVYGASRVIMYDDQDFTIKADRRYPLTVKKKIHTVQNNWSGGEPNPTIIDEYFDGLNEMEGLSLYIKVPKRSQPIVNEEISEKFVILIEGGINFYEGAKRTPEIGIPYNTAFSRMESLEGEQKTNLIIDAAELELYLRNPQGDHSIVSEGKSVRNYDDMTDEQVAHVTLRFIPK
jgi:hypothetical protein